MNLGRFRNAASKIFLGIFIFFIAVCITFVYYNSSVTNNIDTYVYDLPFEKGAKHKIIQGYGGLFSHYHIAALDFEMPEGTAIYAAREGRVFSFKDKSEEGGPFPKYQRKANYIMIRHNDGSFGCYWHLKRNGVLVKSGLVKKGQLIGYSGNTGFTLKPHLHFSVKKVLNYNKNSFVKTRFRTNAGIQLLENGKSYMQPQQ